MIQTWIRLLSSPNESTYQEVALNPDASFGTALVWRSVGILIAAALGFLGTLLGLGGAQEQFQQILASSGDIPPEVRQILEQLQPLFTPAGMGIATIIGIVVSLFVFVLLCFLYHVIARMFGGQGEFGIFSYLSAGIWSPISIVQGLLGLIPLAGACLGLLVVLYGLVLSYFALKTNYRLSDGRAILVLIMPILLLFALAICLAFAIVILVMPAQIQ